MMIGFVGNMGQGKSLVMNVYALFQYYTIKKNNPDLRMFANYNLIEAERYKYISQLWEIENAIVCHDEIHNDMDSRAWKKNIDISVWLAQTRKKNIMYLWASQGFDKVDIRVRKATDWLVEVEKIGYGTHKLHWFNLYSGKKEKITIMTGLDKFFNVYNSFEVIMPLKFKKEG